MLKIITSRADNGNDFLCLNCSHGTRRSGLLSESQIICSNSKLSTNLRNQQVPFKVTQCDGFYHKDLSRENNKKIRAFIRAAHYIEVSEETGQLVIISADKARDRGLWRQVEYDEND